jgi:3D (Asp-Asp-Asp) domain-containing protein
MSYQRSILILLLVLLSYAAQAARGNDIVYESKLESKNSDIEVKYVFDRTLRAGTIKKVSGGTPTKLLTMVQYGTKNGKIISKKVLWTKKEPGEPAIIHIARDGYATTRGSFNRVKVLDMEATAYSSEETSNRTATGRPTGYGVVAVDPRIIPLGTKLYIEGYGFAVAGDTGGAIKGMKIDLGMMNLAECRKFGRRKVRVHVLR